MKPLGKLLVALVALAGVITFVRWQRFDESPAKFWERVRTGTVFDSTAPVAQAGEEAEEDAAPRAVVAGRAAKHAPPAGGKHIRPPAGPETRVLFIGNSLVYSHAMPQMLERLAWSDGVNLRTDQSTVGGMTLQQHGQRAETAALIAEGDWDVVVLQEQSQLPAISRDIIETRTIPGATRLADLVRAASFGARIALYVTPAWRDGDPQFAQYLQQPASSASMQERINATYGDLASRISAIAVPSGPIWQRVAATYPRINLYDDNVHPSQAGAYLIACVFYKALTGRSPLGNAYIAELDATTARILQSFAAGGG
jgi:hypothetical protein